MSDQPRIISIDITHLVRAALATANPDNEPESRHYSRPATIRDRLRTCQTRARKLVLTRRYQSTKRFSSRLGGPMKSQRRSSPLSIGHETQGM